MILGCHVSLKAPDMLLGAVLEGISYNADVIMIYTGAPQNTIRKDISQFKINEARKYNMEIIAHGPYVVNLANKIKHDFSVSFLIEEIKRSKAVGAKQMILHPGNAVSGTKDEAIELIASGINKIIRKTKKEKVIISLETMAGKGNEIGSRFEEIKRIIDRIEDKELIGVCFDTCHVFDSGYDIKNNFDDVILEFDRIIGLRYLKCIHINDTKNVIASHKDRHANIGCGYIGLEALKRIVSNSAFSNIPMILETPYINGLPPYKEEIDLLRK